MPHWGIVRDPPETVVAQFFGGATAVVERITVDLHRETATVRARVHQPGGREQPYDVVLHSGTPSWVSLDTPRVEVMLCSAGFGAWRVAEVRPV